MFDKAELERAAEEIKKSLGKISDRVNPMGSAITEVMKQFTPTKVQTININSEQVEVSILPHNRILLRFKDTSSENNYIKSLTIKRSKLANLIHAFRCLFT